MTQLFATMMNDIHDRILRNLNDVEAFLNATDRDGGMLLFAVDGKTNEAVLFDCLCSKHYRRELTTGWIVGTNHYCYSVLTLAALAIIGLALLRMGFPALEPARPARR